MDGCNVDVKCAGNSGNGPTTISDIPSAKFPSTRKLFSKEKLELA
jgi:hypothetical protein